jgi:hypothetical protein
MRLRWGKVEKPLIVTGIAGLVAKIRQAEQVRQGGFQPAGPTSNQPSSANGENWCERTSINLKPAAESSDLSGTPRQ